MLEPRGEDIPNSVYTVCSCKLELVQSNWYLSSNRLFVLVAAVVLLLLAHAAAVAVGRSAGFPGVCTHLLRARATEFIPLRYTYGITCTRWIFMHARALPRHHLSYHNRPCSLYRIHYITYLCPQPFPFGSHATLVFSRCYEHLINGGFSRFSTVYILPILHIILF